jgi:hypothetical protein
MALWGIMIQCSTCCYEQMSLSGLFELWDRRIDNIKWMDYQDFARKYQCNDYLADHQYL